MVADYLDGTDDRAGPFDERGSEADLDVGALLDRSQAAETAQLEQELAAVDRQLARRDAIHRTIVDALAWKLDRYTAKLRTLYKRHSGTDGTRARVKDRLTELETALHDEYRAHWRDRQDLERARREIQRELANLEDEWWSEIL